MERKRPAGKGEVTLLTGQGSRAIGAAANERDQVFRAERPAIEDFRFGHEVGTVFDDMVTRSVPFYAEIQRMIAEMAADFAIATRSSRSRSGTPTIIGCSSKPCWP